MATFLISEKQKKIYNYIKEKKIVTQPNIINHFKQEFDYKTETQGKKTQIARVSIGSMLKKLEANGLITKTKIASNDKAMLVNQWSIIDKNSDQDKIHK